MLKIPTVFIVLSFLIIHVLFIKTKASIIIIRYTVKGK